MTEPVFASMTSDGAALTITAAEARPLVEAGEAKTLALISGERSSLYPDLPTTDETFGIEWSPLPFRGLAGPKNLPAEVTEKVSAALKEITEDPAFLELMSSRGFSVAYQDAVTFDQTVHTAGSSLGAAMKAAGLGQ